MVGRPKFLVCRSFLSKVCQKKFSRSGTPKIDDFGPFFKNRCPKFLPTRKKRVFRVADFFEKSRKWRFILRVRPNFFSPKLINIAGLACKNYDGRARTRRFLEDPMSVSFLSQHST